MTELTQKPTRPEAIEALVLETLDRVAREMELDPSGLADLLQRPGQADIFLYRFRAYERGVVAQVLPQALRQFASDDTLPLPTKTIPHYRGA